MSSVKSPVKFIIGFKLKGMVLLHRQKKAVIDLQWCLNICKVSIFLHKQFIFYTSPEENLNK